jgi:hypothetical protein
LEGSQTPSHAAPTFVGRRFTDLSVRSWRALHPVENETALADVKRDVLKLCGRFPLHAARLAAYEKALARA